MRFLILIIFTIFSFINCSQGMNKPSRCNSDLVQKGYLDPELCSIFLPTLYYGANDKNSSQDDRVLLNTFLNGSIISCIQWRLEKNKCNKKSEWSPP